MIYTADYNAYYHIREPVIIEIDHTTIEHNGYEWPVY